MAELGYEDQSSSRSAFRARDASPDSVIFTLESNFSLFSSASASVDRCSFASDAHDHDTASEISLPFSKSTSLFDSFLHSYAVPKVDSEGDIEDDKQALDSARSSFSLALKECQERRSRSDALRKLDRRRPASLDFNNATASSPRMGGVKKSSMGRKAGAFPSPGTPNYQHGGVGLQKGWSSERVPLQSTAGRRNAGAAFLPYNNNGRTLPSKWEDAERWILSPVSGDGGPRPSVPLPQRRPKSKSGPLGPPGVAYYSLYSPAMPMFEGGNMGNFMAGSPFSAGVIGADGLNLRNSGCHGAAFPIRAEPCMGRSASVHGCSEHLNQPPTTVPQELADEKLEGVKDAATDICHDVSRRDMATQMSPDGSASSSPKERLSFTTSPSLSIVDLQSTNGSKLGVKDVQVDEQVTFTRWSKKKKYGIPGKGSGVSEDWRKKDTDTRSSTWEISETTKNVSKAKREEAKITAWENLQKAKAEAAIRKLEMKLEKKRSSSMDKIMKKLRLAQKRAQEMRSSVLANQSHEVSRTSHKAVVFRRTHQMSSLSGCFTCHAF
ncbi:hypothetical protein CDL15_Pgr006747 [Punica granatum]|uniref:Remorin C-terminal domain-containing protein n=1 Tax=Punica granatum TaxID=22663 RepID=A0A218X6Z4_PUNGR|nr:hypothetical protein CDL15_Pgr006747 [Punica granatum]